ncbi:MAG: uracil-DNA glycosylase, partial [Clostridia bacterium]|nr:uracil-DNA glycosylase [Clostridia bacterium]
MRASWTDLRGAVEQCTLCPLCQHRKNTVLGEGNPQSPLMLVGEGPGEQEDLTGRPFVGAAGQLLDRMLAAIGLGRNSVYICNVVKCRPPQNRTPEPDEMTACMGYLRQQFVLVHPKVILCLGATPSRAIIDPNIRITRQRGQWQLKRGVWIMPTYHPAALIYDGSKKRDSWSDLQQVRAKLMELGVYEQMTAAEAAA